MEDTNIVDMYWARNEQAITETSDKYGNYCHKIAMNILYSEEDSKESVNDTYLKAWNSMPTDRPNILSAYLAAIVRNISLDIYRKNHSLKRGAGQTTEVIDELYDIAGGSTPEAELDNSLLTQAINDFLGTLKTESRMIFIRRYFYMDSIKDISANMHIGEGKIKTVLLRTRNSLKEYLCKEGFTL